MIKIKKIASVYLVSILSLGLFYVLFSPLLIATTKNVTPSSAVKGLISFFSPFSSYQTAKAATGTVTDPVVVSVIVDKEVLISAPADFTLTGTILGVTGGSALGTVTWQVISSSQAGFAMTLKAGATPALATGSYRFQDYTTGTTSFAWNAPAAGTTSFAFSVGADSVASAAAAFKTTGASAPCGIVAGDTNSTNNCWEGFNGTNAIAVVNTTAFSAASVTESFALKASFTPQAGYAIPADIYRATVTATVTVN